MNMQQETAAPAAATVSTQAERLVKVFSTVGSNRKSECLTSAATWAELKSEMKDKGVLLDGMKAIVGGTEVTLESPNAQLPTEQFMLFLVPDKVKSGCRGDNTSSASTGAAAVGTVEEDDFDEEVIDKEEAIEILESGIKSLTLILNFLKGNPKKEVAPVKVGISPEEQAELDAAEEALSRLKGYSL